MGPRHPRRPGCLQSMSRKGPRPEPPTPPAPPPAPTRFQGSTHYAEPRDPGAPTPCRQQALRAQTRREEAGPPPSTRHIPPGSLGQASAFCSELPIHGFSATPSGPGRRVCVNNALNLGPPEAALAQVAVGMGRQEGVPGEGQQGAVPGDPLEDGAPGSGTLPPQAAEKDLAAPSSWVPVTPLPWDPDSGAVGGEGPRAGKATRPRPRPPGGQRRAGELPEAAARIRPPAANLRPRGPRPGLQPRPAFPARVPRPHLPLSGGSGWRCGPRAHRPSPSPLCPRSATHTAPDGILIPECKVRVPLVQAAPS